MFTPGDRDSYDIEGLYAKSQEARSRSRAPARVSDESRCDFPENRRKADWRAITYDPGRELISVGCGAGEAPVRVDEVQLRVLSRKEAPFVSG